MSGLTSSLLLDRLRRVERGRYSGSRRRYGRWQPWKWPFRKTTRTFRFRRYGKKQIVKCKKVSKAWKWAATRDPDGNLPPLNLRNYHREPRRGYVLDLDTNKFRRMTLQERANAAAGATEAGPMEV